MQPVMAMQEGSVLAGRYALNEVLGRGGFGSVYAATQLNLGRRVAIKLLRPELLAHDSGLGRFRREAELAQRLQHPNTVRVLDYGQSEQGAPFIVFELLEGSPLDKELQRVGRMPAARVARVASQVLKSLMEAHGHGIVHRDIKPSNLFLCDFQGEPDFVKVLDFGIAKVESSTNTLTGEGQMVGTPAYMAPEQVLAEGIGPHTDLYALGLVMAECISGLPVFAASGGARIAIDQASPAPAPLSADVQSSVLGAVIRRAVEKHPNARYPSAEAMLRDLELALHSSRPEALHNSVGGGYSTQPSQPISPVAHTPGGTALLPASTGMTPDPHESGLRPITPSAPQGYSSQGPGSGAPTLHAYTPQTTAPPPARSAMTLVLAGAAVALLSAAVGALALYFVVDDDSPTEKPAAPPPTQPAAAPKSEGSMELSELGSMGGGFDHFSFERATGTLKTRGYEVGKVRVNLEGSYVTQSATLTPKSKGKQAGTLNITRFQSIERARTFATTSRQNLDSAVERDRRAVLVVTVPGNKRQAEAVLDLVSAANPPK